MQVLVLRVASLGFMDLLFNRQTYPSLLLGLQSFRQFQLMQAGILRKISFDHCWTMDNMVPAGGMALILVIVSPI